MSDTLSKSERTRQFIIEKTAPVFNKKGYAGTSMSDMTAATGLTKGSIYGNFEDKEQVAFAAFRHNIAIRNKAIMARVSAATTWKARLLAFPAAFSSKNNHVFPKGGCPLLNTGIEADDTHEAFRKATAKELQHWKKDLLVIIRSGIASGEFRKTMAVEQMALSIIALIEGGIFISQSTRNPGYLDAILETVKDLIEQMAKPAKGK